MKILVVGNGGREHALAWKIAQSPRSPRVFVAPGNAGTAQDAENIDIPSTDIPRLLKFARDGGPVDAVYVATPPGSHAEYALRVAEAGKPCYVEKPMARNHAECAAMVEAFRAKGLPLFVAYYRRALPRFLKAKERIDAGALGKVTGVTYTNVLNGEEFEQPA